MARLSNLNSLYLVPVLAVRKLLAQKLGEDEARLAELNRLARDQLVLAVDREYSISEDDVTHLYNSFRYGRRLALQLYLLPHDFTYSGTWDTIVDAIVAQTGVAAVLDETANGGEEDADDYDCDVVKGRVIYCDSDPFDDVLEIRFRYLVVHRYLDQQEDAAEVLETRYGYVWLNAVQRYVAVLAKDGSIAAAMLDIIAQRLKVKPQSVQFPRDLIDRHFELQNAKRFTHLDANTGVRQSISGDREALAGYLGEINARDIRYQRPGVLYEEVLDETMRSGLGISTKRGRIYFTRTLSTQQIRHWVGTRLSDFVADLRASLDERPEKVYQASALVRRLRNVDDNGKMLFDSLFDAVAWAKRESLQTVYPAASASAFYTALGDAWLTPRYTCSCPECDDACGLCPGCYSSKIKQVGEDLVCSKCDQKLSAHGRATLCCTNHHVHQFDLAGSVGYLPTPKLHSILARALQSIQLSWNMERETIYLDAGGLHYFCAPADTINNYYGDFTQGVIYGNPRNVIIGNENVLRVGGDNGGQERR